MKSPWLLGDVQWTARLQKQAVVWLARKLQKSILKLTAEDHAEHSLQVGTLADSRFRSVLAYTSRFWPMLTERSYLPNTTLPSLPLMGSSQIAYVLCCIVAQLYSSESSKCYELQGVAEQCSALVCRTCARHVAQQRPRMLWSSKAFRIPSQTPQQASAPLESPLAGPAGAQHRLTIQQCLCVSHSLAVMIACRILNLIDVASP